MNSSAWVREPETWDEAQGANTITQAELRKGLTSDLPTKVYLHNSRRGLVSDLPTKHSFLKRNNPVYARLGDFPEQYKYSSAFFYD